LGGERRCDERETSDGLVASGDDASFVDANAATGGTFLFFCGADAFADVSDGDLAALAVSAGRGFAAESVGDLADLEAGSTARFAGACGQAEMAVESVFFAVDVVFDGFAIDTREELTFDLASAFLADKGGASADDGFAVLLCETIVEVGCACAAEAIFTEFFGLWWDDTADAAAVGEGKAACAFALGVFDGAGIAVGRAKRASVRIAREEDADHAILTGFSGLVATVAVVEDFLSTLVDASAVACETVGVAEDDTAFACAVGADIVVPVAVGGFAGAGIAFSVAGSAGASVEANVAIFARSAADGVGAAIFATAEGFGSIG